MDLVSDGGSVILRQTDVDHNPPSTTLCFCFKSLCDLYLICFQDPHWTLWHFIFLSLSEKTPHLLSFYSFFYSTRKRRWFPLKVSQSMNLSSCCHLDRRANDYHKPLLWNNKKRWIIFMSETLFHQLTKWIRHISILQFLACGRSYCKLLAQ